VEVTASEACYSSCTSPNYRNLEKVSTIHWMHRGYQKHIKNLFDSEPPGISRGADKTCNYKQSPHPRNSNTPYPKPKKIYMLNLFPSQGNEPPGSLFCNASFKCSSRQIEQYPARLVGRSPAVFFWPRKPAFHARRGREGFHDLLGLFRSYDHLRDTLSTQSLASNKGLLLDGS
jgi:hypothetical protein